MAKIVILEIVRLIIRPVAREEAFDIIEGLANERRGRAGEQRCGDRLSGLGNGRCAGGVSRKGHAWARSGVAKKTAAKQAVSNDLRKVRASPICVYSSNAM